jgi:hypothetical protein
MRKFLDTLGSVTKRLFPGSETSAAKAARPRSRLQRFEQLEQRTLLSITSEGLAALNIDLADSLETAYHLYVPDAPDLDSASDTGASSTDNITSDNTPTFTGLVPPGSYVALYEGDVLLGSRQLAAEVEAYAITSSQLADGVHDITVRVAASAEAPEHKVSPALAVTIDTAAPTVAIDEAPNRDSAIGSIDFTFSEAVTGVDISALELTFNDGANLLGDGQSVTTTDQLIYTLGGLSGLTAEAGAYLLTINAPGAITDIAGNPLAAGGHQAWNQYLALLQGTPGNDTITFTTGAKHTVSINRTNVYHYDPAVVTEIRIDARDGNDTITITGSAGSDTATLGAGSVEVAGPADASYRLSATSVETIRVHSGGGSDAATLTGSPGIDYLNAYPERCLMYNGERSYRNEVHGFASVTVDVSGTETPGDSAYIRDSQSDDLFITDGEHATMTYGAEGPANIVTIGFKNVLAYSENGGSDAAALAGSAGLDEFYAFTDKSYLRVDGRTYFHYAAGFSRVDATAGTGGNDIARFYDSAGNDTLTVGPEVVAMDCDPELLDLAVSATGFQRVYAYAQNGGDDVANLSGSAGDDRFVARPESSYISLAGGKSNAQINGFKQVTVDVSPAEPGADSGADYAYVYDSPESDVLTAGPAEATIDYGANTLIDVAMHGFDRVYAYSENGGDDAANLTGSPGIDYLNAYPDRCLMYDTPRTYRTDVRGFAVVTVDVSNTETPGDSAYIRDSQFDDLFITDGQHTTMTYGAEGPANIVTIGFKNVLAYSENGGSDAATLTGSAGLDEFYAFTDKSYLRVDGRTYFHYAAGFSRVDATAGTAGNDIARFYDSTGDDTLTVGPETVAMDYDPEVLDLAVTATGFRRVYAYSQNGGDDVANLSGSAGDDRFVARPESFYISLAGGKSNAQINGFKQVTVDVSPAEPGADSGTDYAYVYDSPESDVLTAGPAEAAMDYGANTLIDVAMLGFDRLYAYSENGGFDEANLTGSPGIDSLNADPDRCLMYHAERTYRTDVRGFAVVTVDVSSAETPADSAYIRDSPFDDLFITNGEHAAMNYGGDAWDNIITIGFKNVLAYSENGGDDAAMLTGSAGLDEFYGFADKSYLRVDGRTYFHYAAGFSSVEATGANLGNDIARLYGSASPTGDRFTASPERAAIDFGNTGFDDIACDGFRRVYADFSSGGGSNELWLTDSIGKDRFTGSGDSGSLTDGSRYWINFHGLGPDDMVWLLSVDEGNTMKKENVDYLLEYFPDFWDEF